MTWPACENFRAVRLAIAAELSGVINLEFRNAINCSHACLFYVKYFFFIFYVSLHLAL